MASPGLRWTSFLRLDTERTRVLAKYYRAKGAPQPESKQFQSLKEQKAFEKGYPTTTMNLSLYSVNAFLILDTEGTRIIAKYYRPKGAPQPETTQRIS